MLIVIVVSVVVSLALYWMPYNLWLIVAAFAAMIAGAETERQMGAKA